MGMDYDTFINSAFLLQGRADEFTNKRPGERKEVLAKVIGLERYDQLEDMAKQRSQEKRGESQEMERQLEQLRLEVSKAGAVELELEGVERELARVVEGLEAKREVPRRPEDPSPEPGRATSRSGEPGGPCPGAQRRTNSPQIRERIGWTHASPVMPP